MADRYPCHACKKDVARTKTGLYRSHTDGGGGLCPNGAEPVPEHILAAGPVTAGDDPAAPREGVDCAVCPQCERKVKLTRLGYFEPHDQTMRGGDRCPVSGVRAMHARKLDDVPLPGYEDFKDQVLGSSAMEGLSADPRAKEAQYAADARLREMSDSGGLLLSDQAAQNKAMGAVNRSEQASTAYP